MTTNRSGSSVDLTGQVALVTGGGRGLGRAFAQALAVAGAAVAVTARSPDQLAETVAAITASEGHADALSGCYVEVTDDLDSLVQRAAEITEDDLYALRVHTF